jgi:AAA ATPase domain
MQIDRIRISNFRCLQEGALACNPLTVLVGRNGAGKSSFFYALDLFYKPNATIITEELSNREGATIAIEVTFTGLRPEERDAFQVYLDGCLPEEPAGSGPRALLRVSGSRRRSEGQGGRVAFQPGARSSGRPQSDGVEFPRLRRRGRPGRRRASAARRSADDGKKDRSWVSGFGCSHDWNVVRSDYRSARVQLRGRGSPVLGAIRWREKEEQPCLQVLPYSLHTRTSTAQRTIWRGASRSGNGSAGPKTAGTLPRSGILQSTSLIPSAGWADSTTPSSF